MATRESLPSQRQKKKASPELGLTPEKVLARFDAGPKSGVFTDGACTGNPGPGGWGVVWVDDDRIVAQDCGAAPDTTNNRMELSALIAAFEMLPRDAKVDVFSDSELCVKTLNLWAASWQRRGWKRKTGPVQNLDLVQRAYGLKLAHPGIRLQWIKAHDGSRWNEYADALATSYLRGGAPRKQPAFPQEEVRRSVDREEQDPEAPLPRGEGFAVRASAAAPAKDPDGLDVEGLRADTPGCQECVHLDNAGAALMPRPVLAAIREHLELEARIGGYAAADARAEAIADAYQAVAELLGCRPRNVAMVENATVAVAQALSSIPFAPGDAILTTNNDYASNQIMFLALGRRFGVEVVRAPDLEEGGVDPQAMCELVRRRRPKLVAVTQMPTDSGLLQPVQEIGKLCQELEVPFLVDGCQTVGQLPLDVGKLQCDFFAGSSRKFLRGPRGSGFLIVSDRLLERGVEPLLPDLRGARWEASDRYRIEDSAQRFENWDFSYLSVLGTGAAARYALALDAKAVMQRSRSLAARARRRLGEVAGVRALDRGAWLGAIASFAVDGWEPEALQAELRRRRINANVSYRRWNQIDFERQGLDWTLRVSPHYYNTEDEIDVVAAAVAELQSRRRSQASTAKPSSHPSE